MKLRVAVLSVGLAAFVLGCGSTKYVNDTRSQTTGQELVDLEKAHKDGIITEREYNQQKKKILNRK